MTLQAKIYEKESVELSSYLKALIVCAVNILELSSLPTVFIVKLCQTTEDTYFDRLTGAINKLFILIVSLMLLFSLQFEISGGCAVVSVSSL